MGTEAETQDDQQQTDEKPYVRMKREDIQALEASAAKAKDLDVVQRELAMTKAGVDTDSPMGKMFFKAYEGELTKEAITTAAQEIGLMKEGEEKTELSPEEKGSTQERQTLNNGATPPGGENPAHPRDEAKAAAQKVVEDGGKYEHAAGAYLSTMVRRYAEGDKRAVRDPRERFSS